jgi:hypothetical protein
MAARKATPEDLKRIEELAKRWGKIIVREQWGTEGPGLDVDLTEMEDIGMAAVRGLMAGTLESATQQQAVQLGDQLACPTCGKICPVVPEERSIVVRGGGSFEHREPKGHCPACRRDFFPSASGAETGHPRLQSSGAEQNHRGDSAREVAQSRRKNA